MGNFPDCDRMGFVVFGLCRLLKQSNRGDICVLSGFAPVLGGSAPGLQRGVLLPAGVVVQS